MSQVVIFVVPLVCVLAGIAGIGLYVVLTNSGSRLRGVVRHKIRELDPAAQKSKSRSRARDLAVYCSECERQTTTGKFCSHCGSPLF